MTPELREWHIAFGRHSNIPECCVQFYVDWWWDARVAGSPLAQEYWDTMQAAKDGPKVGYVRCPVCLKDRRRVTLHICSPKKCGKFLRSIGMLDEDLEQEHVDGVPDALKMVWKKDAG